MAPVVYLLLTTLVWPILLASLLGSPHCAAMCGDLLRERTDRDAFARVLDLFRRTLP
jgi:sulfite exporter TauE/SafE